MISYKYRSCIATVQEHIQDHVHVQKLYSYNPGTFQMIMYKYRSGVATMCGIANYYVNRNTMGQYTNRRQWLMFRAVPANNK